MPLFSRLRERHHEAERRKDFRMGLLTAAVYNARREKRTDKIWNWTDFYGEPERKDAEPMDDEQMLANMFAFSRRQAGKTN